MNLKHVKCYNCHAKGHLSKSCPEAKKKPSHRVGVEESIKDTPEQLVKEEKGNSTERDPWMRNVSADKSEDVHNV